MVWGCINIDKALGWLFRVWGSLGFYQYGAAQEQPRVVDWWGFLLPPHTYPIGVTMT